MMYISLLLIINFIAIICFYKNKRIKLKNKKFFLFLSFMVLIFISGFRSLEVGVDTLNYYKHFNIILNSSFFDICTSFKYYSIEIGYNIVAKICSLIVPNYLFFQFVVSLICGIGMMKFIENNINNVYLGVILYLGLGIYLYEFNLSRQMLAVVFVINSWDFFLKKKNLLCFIFLLIACTFHITAIVFIIAFIIYYFKDRRWIYILSISIITFFIFNYDVIIKIAQQIFPTYRNYFVNERTIQNVGFITILWIGIFVIAVLNIIKKNNSGLDFCISIFSLIYIACNLIGLQFNYFERIGLYFLPFVIILIEKSKFLIPKNFRIYYLILLILIFSILFLKRASTDQYNYSFYYPVYYSEFIAEIEK